MNLISEIMENKTETRIDKCKYCGKQYEEVEHKFKIGDKERVIKIQAPTCNCEELRKQREQAAKDAAHKKEVLAKKFENSLMTPLFKEKRFNLLEKTAPEYGNEKEFKILKSYTEQFRPQVSKGIFLTGKPGTGKTTLIAAVANQLMENGYEVLFITFSALIERFTKYSYENSGDILPLLMWLVKFDFIVIDDIGRETYTERRKEIAFRIIDTILNYKVVTAFTANPEMVEKLQKIEDWGATLDRLKDICGMQINFKGDSQRGRKWLL